MRFVRYMEREDGTRAVFMFGPVAGQTRVELVFTEKALGRLVWWLCLLRRDCAEKQKVLAEWPPAARSDG